jgi:hypothetical protein
LVSAPTAGAIDMPLSLSTTIRGVSSAPALFIASYAMPPLMAPSPMTQMTLLSVCCRSRAMAMPRPAEIEVELCAAPKQSYSLS